MLSTILEVPARLSRTLLPGLALITAATGAAEATPELKPGHPIDYSKLAFQPESWKQRELSTDLVPWAGEEIIFLSVDDSLDPKLMRLWVSRLDAGWKLYADLTGQRPRPFKQHEGRATIAGVPSSELTCGVGCGYIGATGIELAKFYQQDYPQLEERPEAMPHYVFYEMGRNFYTFEDRHSCFITGFAVFMRYVCMDALEVEDPDLATRNAIESMESHFKASDHGFLDLFTTSTGIGEKEARIHDGEGRLLHPSDQPVTYASAMMRLHRECGGNAWLRGFFRALASSPPSSPHTLEGARGQAWSWLLSASLAARKDLSPIFVDEWKLPLAKETRAALAEVDWSDKDLEPKRLFDSLKPEWNEVGATAK